MNEKQKKYVLKTLSWRLIATSTTIFLAYGVTGRIEFVAWMLMGDMTLKTLFYYLHERAWHNNSHRVLNLSFSQRQSDSTLDVTTTNRKLAS